MPENESHDERSTIYCVLPYSFQYCTSPRPPPPRRWPALPPAIDGHIGHCIEVIASVGLPLNMFFWKLVLIAPGDLPSLHALLAKEGSIRVIGLKTGEFLKLLTLKSEVTILDTSKMDRLLSSCTKCRAAIPIKACNYGSAPFFLLSRIASAPASGL